MASRAGMYIETNAEENSSSNTGETSTSWSSDTEKSEQSVNHTISPNQPPVIPTQTGTPTGTVDRIPSQRSGNEKAEASSSSPRQIPATYMPTPTGERTPSSWTQESTRMGERIPQWMSDTEKSQHVIEGTSFRTQANALMRKNLNFQKRKLCTNLCLIGFPIILCTLLILFQTIINRLLAGPARTCGCQCMPTNDTGVCIKECGIQYSTPYQAAFCAIPTPARWPAALQVPFFLYREVDMQGEFTGLPDISCRALGTCPASFLYTGNTQSIAADIVSGFFTSSGLSNASDLLRTLSEVVPATHYGIGTTNFLEPAFYSSREVYIMQPSCASIPYPYSSCLQTLLLWRDDANIINRELYQGYYKGNPHRMANEISSAYDFGNTSPVKLDVTIWYNDTLRGSALNKAPGMLRLPRAMNMVSQAFLRYVKGSSAQLPLWFVSEMPKGATRIRLDFSALLGPLFFMWVIQLLLPASKFSG